MTATRIPEPQVSESYRLEEVRVTSVEDSERAYLHYTDGDATLRLAVFPDATFEPRGVNVAVGNGQGTITEAQGTIWLYWECDGTLHWINGPMKAQELVSIAESVDCQVTS